MFANPHFILRFQGRVESQQSVIPADQIIISRERGRLKQRGQLRLSGHLVSRVTCAIGLAIRILQRSGSPLTHDIHILDELLIARGGETAEIEAETLASHWDLVLENNLIHSLTNVHQNEIFRSVVGHEEEYLPRESEAETRYNEPGPRLHQQEPHDDRDLDRQSSQEVEPGPHVPSKLNSVHIIREIRSTVWLAKGGGELTADRGHFHLQSG